MYKFILLRKSIGLCFILISLQKRLPTDVNCSANADIHSKAQEETAGGIWSIDKQQALIIQIVQYVGNTKVTSMSCSNEYGFYLL